MAALDTEDEFAVFVSDALMRGDSVMLLDALKALAWSRFISQMVPATGMAHSQLAPMLQGHAPLTLDVAMKLLCELKLTVSVSPAPRTEVVAPAAARVPSSPHSLSSGERTLDTGGAVYVRRF